MARLDTWPAIAAVGRLTPDGAIRSPEQCLTAEDALASSVDGHRPATIGTSDLVVLNEDPTRLGAAQLAVVGPEVTIIGGDIVYQR